MPFINLPGLVFMGIIMVPNIVFAVKHRDGLENLWENKAVAFFEQAGRIGCFAFMIFNIPKTFFGFGGDRAFKAYLICNTVLVFAYCLVWIVCFNKPGMTRAVLLSVLPSAVFVVSAILSRSVLLFASAVLFAPCHILISCKNVSAFRDFMESGR